MFANIRILVLLTIPLAVSSFVVLPPSRRVIKPLFLSEPVTEEALERAPDEDANAKSSVVAEGENAHAELTPSVDAMASANGSPVAEKEEGKDDDDDNQEEAPELKLDEAASAEREEEEAAELKPVDEAASTKGDDEEEAAPELTPDEAASAKRKIQRERHTLFIGNIPFDKTETDVKELCQQYGKVEVVTMPKDRNTQRPRGFAFVDMSSPEEVEAAIAAVDGSTLEGRELRASKSVPKGEVPTNRSQQRGEPREGTKKIYCGNLPFGSTEEDISELYSEFGEVLEVFIPVDQSGQGRGFAFVTMKEEDADKAIEVTNGMDFDGRTLVVNEPLPPGEKAPSRRGRKTKLYVGNLSFYTVPETLEELFGEFGEVFDCYLPEDPATGGSRGFGFVTMDPEDAQRAIEEINGCEVDGRTIRVNEAMPKGRKRQQQNDDMDDEEMGVISGSWDDMDQ